MVIRNVLSSRFKIGYLLMVVCVITFNACNRTPCTSFKGYAPRYFPDLDKFVWTGCADPNITIEACDFKDIDKSRYIVVQYIPDRNTYKLIRGQYPGVETQYVEQAGGDYWFVNVDDFARQATSASDGEYNYPGATHRFAGAAIMIDYRYAAARADALSHTPCGGGVPNFDCMSDDFKMRLSDCFYSEDEPAETGYVPYIIDRTACTPGDNFRINAPNSIVIEDCTPPYYIDTHWLKDQFSPTSGDRILYIGVNIDPFDPAKRYALYIEDGLAVIYKGELGYFNGNTHIVEVLPNREPRTPAAVQFTVQARVYMNASPLSNPQQKSYNVSVKEFVDNINSPTGPVTSISPVTLELNNRYLHQGVPYKERVMSIQFLGNSGTTFNSNVSGLGFHATFTKVWTNSEIHAYPNYLPSGSYKPSVNPGVPNTTPGNTVLPNYLVDSDGYGVILDTDFNNADLSSDQSCYDDLLEWGWEMRLEAYLSHINNNEANDVNTLAKLEDTRNEAAAQVPPYQNQVSVLAITGFRIYEVDPGTGELKRNPNGTLAPHITATKLFPSGGTLTAYRASLQTGTLGATISLPSAAQYHPVIVIDVGLITQLTGASNLSTKIMATTMHELAHAWFNKKVTDDALDNGTPAGGALSHAAYVKGAGSAYCLMRYCPAGQENNMGSISSTVMQQFTTNQLNQMAFSRSIQQRLANVMAMTYDN